ncbi:MAG: cytochrome hydroxylase [Conexibacter sp.]|nr:cytochrome hydroxylase [Conexibacter sp.]
MPIEKIDFNPFAPDVIENPYPGLRALREQAPVYEVEGLGLRIISRYDDVVHALRKPQLLSSTIIDMMFTGEYSPVPGGSGSHNMMAKDPPDHTRLRRLVNRAFTPEAVGRMRAGMDEFVAAAIERNRGAEEWDFVDEIGKALPLNVFFNLLGVEPDMFEQARAWSDDLMSASRITVGRETPTPERDAYLKGAMKDYGDYMVHLVDLRRKQPGEDLISGLVQAADEGEKLSQQEVITMIHLLIGAGTESTQKLISNTLLALLHHPDQYAQLRQDPSLIPGAVQEVLRYDGPALYMARIATQDVEIAGVTIPSDAVCLVSYASANHDESKFPDAETFDIHRDTSGIIAFGNGIHRCLGAHLATLEGTVVLEHLVRNFSGFGWDPARIERDDSFFIRGLNHLPITTVAA